MRLSTRNLVSWAMAAGLLAAACHSDPGPYVQTTVAKLGTQDLRCPSEQVSVYEAASGVFVARGCGTWTSYDCVVRYVPYSSDWDVNCTPHVVEVHRSPPSPPSVQPAASQPSEPSSPPPSQAIE